MLTRPGLLSAFLVALVVACSDTPPPEVGPTPSLQPARSRDETRAERERVARQLRMAKGSASIAPTPPELNDRAQAMAQALDVGARLKSVLLSAPGLEGAFAGASFGDIKPRKGTSLAVMSTGHINSDSRLPEPGTDYEPFGEEGDVVTLTVTLTVPVGVNRLSFDYRFLSAESPEFIGTQFNDQFTAVVRDNDGTRVRVVEEASVNSSHFFDASETRAKNTKFDKLLADDPAGTDYFPTSYPPRTPTFPDAGITDFKIVHVPVVPGDVVIEFSIRDVGDGIFDSTVVLDNLRVSSLELIDPNPALVVQEHGTVEVDPVKLSTPALDGKRIVSVAADGATQLLLRVQVPGPGKMDFTLKDVTTLVNGGVGALGSSTQAVTVNVTALPGYQGEYYAFALYTSPEDFNDAVSADKSERTVLLGMKFTPDMGTGYEDTYELSVVRPPVVAIHDIWSNCLYWTEHAEISSNPLFNVTCADYSATNSASMDHADNKAVLGKAIDEALSEARDKDIAVTQVEVLAHGMGGLMARRFVDGLNYKSASNFNKGTVNRLITLNTPHMGSRIADELKKVKDKLLAMDGGVNGDQWQIFKNTLQDAGIQVSGPLGGAIDELRTDSGIIANIKTTPVPSHIMFSRGGLAVNRVQSTPLLMPFMTALYTNMEFLHPMWDGTDASAVVKRTLILGENSKIFCTDDHDMFLAQAEQFSGDAGTAASPFVVNRANKETEHFMVPADVAHQDKIETLLNSPVNGPNFAPSLLAPSLVTRQPRCAGGAFAPSGGSLVTEAEDDDTLFEYREPTQTELELQEVLALAGGLRITSPAPGTVVTPGSIITVSVEATGGFVPEALLIVADGHVVRHEGRPLTVQFQVPPKALGGLSIIATGIALNGEIQQSSAVSLTVSSSAVVTSLSVLNGDAHIRGVGQTSNLVVVGDFSDGVKRDVTAAATGTIYSTSNPSVAVVSANGVVTGVGPGLATLVVRNTTIATSITVAVKEGTTAQCLEVRLGDYNLFVLEDYRQGMDVGGRVAAGGNILLTDFRVGWKLPATETANVLVAGNDMRLQNGTVWGNTRFGSHLTTVGPVIFQRGTAARGTPIDFAARGESLRTLSGHLKALPANGTTTLETWGGVLLKGTSPKVNVFNVPSTAFASATLLSIDAPANSLAVINVSGTTARFTNFGHVFAGGIDETGVLFNLPDATSLTAFDYGFYGTVLAPNANVSFNSGSWVGSIYARSMTGNAVGHISHLRDTDICP
ncbi:choice-of-anchor A family protein [Myxococcus sp. K38C18041901]|uniref:choice-of-anchor A family protein n=1 Tax=Myxococcus guangdongensis TaxID=2906760 RepID=UPI0020A8105D|nr:choice-of-anchor A family protein [Myxococcus guangdongensis]MCP3061951.1 choice-of-anchor A family protein [Myxococcus guangdongensis]